MRKSQNHVQRRYYLQGDLELKTPLILGCGRDTLADIECLRDWYGKPFIPGSSLAGVCRHVLSGWGIAESVVEQCFGEHKDDGKHSLLTFHDAPAHGQSVFTDVRDGIKLDSLTKTVLDKKKYDYEVILPGRKFRFRLEAVQRAKQVSELETVLAAIKELFEKEVVRIGAKSNRGYGVVGLTSVQTTVFFMPEQADKWLAFDWNNFSMPWAFSADGLKSPYDFELHATFEIPDSLLIRRYGINPDDPDATTMQDAHGQAVITGVAWNGALRHALENIGRELRRYDRMKMLIEGLFGDVKDEERSDTAVKSRVRIEETVVRGGKLLNCVRTRIDRFTGGVVHAALFDERPLYGGTAELKLQVLQCREYEVGMILLALKELQNGIQTVGGASNIGRGRLAMGSLERLQYRNKPIGDDFQPYFKALALKLGE